MDARIRQYRRAVEGMREGQFDVEIAPGTDDEIGKLGEALASVSRNVNDKLELALAMCGVLERMSAGLGVVEVCDDVYDSLRAILPYDRMGLALLSEDGNSVHARWARSEVDELEIGPGYQARLAGSSLERILDSGEPRILNDLEAHLAEHPGSESTRRIVAEGMRSSLTCPLTVEGEPVGFVFFSSRQPNTYSRDHVAAFAGIAAHLATVVEKSRLYEEALELNLLKNRLLGVVAHDVRSPLIAFSEYLRLLDAGAYGTLPLAAARVLRKLARSSMKMRRRIDELLDASSIETGDLTLNEQTVDPGEYLEDRYRELRLLAEAKSIALWLDIEPDLPDVRIDPVRIDQALSNLVANAVRFSYPDTATTIGARFVGDEVEVFVSDQGQGIPEEELSALIADAGTGAGTGSIAPALRDRSAGIGLALAKRVIAAHGSTLRARSIPGKGSTFSFALPLAGSNLPPSAARSELNLVDL